MLSVQYHLYNPVMLAAVMPGTKLQEHTGSDKAWVWSTMDFASEEHRMELFCLKLPSPASKAKHAVLAVLMPLYKTLSAGMREHADCILLYRSARIQKAVWGGHADKC